MPVTAYSTTAASNNGAPPNGAPEAMAPSAVNDTIRQIMADIALEAQINNVKVLKSVSGTNTITADMDPELGAYSAGMLVVMTPANTNTGAVTLAIDGLSALDILKLDGDAIAAGDLTAGVPALLMLDSGADDFYLLNPQIPSEYTAYKTSDTSRSSTVTVSDDPHLTCALVAGTYEVDMLLLYHGTTTTTQGLRYKLAYSGTVTGSAMYGSGTYTTNNVGGVFNFASDPITNEQTFPDNSNSATLPDFIRYCGLVTVTTSGTFSVQWAQEASSANATTLKTRSYLNLKRIA